MKNLITFCLLSIASLFCRAQNSAYVCAGSSFTITVSNSLTLTNPSYSLNPGGITNNTGIFVVSPTSSTSYTTYVSGLNAQNNMTTSVGSVDLTIHPNPIVSHTVTGASCGNPRAFAVLSVTAGAYSIAWSNTPLDSLFIFPGTPVNNANSVVYTGTVTDNPCSTTFSLVIPPSTALANFSINSTAMSNPYAVNCNDPIISLNAIPSGNNYTWTPSSSPTSSVTGASVTLNSGSTPGNWTVIGKNPVTGCSTSTIINVTVNLSVPVTTVTPLFQNINCALNSVTNVSAVVSPTLGVQHEFISPANAVYTAASYTAIYSPTGPGTYTHCATNLSSGCKTCKTFTVTSSSTFPNYIFASQNNYTLGCGQKSIDVVQFTNPQGVGGGAVSFTLLSGLTGTNLPGGILSANTSYTLNTPGTYTMVIRDNGTQCEVRTPITITQNTTAPYASVSFERNILSCKNPSVVLKGNSASTFVSYNWNYVTPLPQSVAGQTILVNVVLPFSYSVIASYSLTVVDSTNYCSTTTIVPMYQNVYMPHAAIGGGTYLTCLNPSVTLNNQSSSTIPTSSMFPITQPVPAIAWYGPFPQPIQYHTSSYLALTPGIYTLIAKDLNNGCVSTGTYQITDNRVLPAIFFQNNDPEYLPCPGTVTLSATSNVPNLTYSWTTSSNPTVMSSNSNSIITASPGIYSLTIQNVYTGCSSTASISVWACVGMPELKNNLDLQVFPNPSHGRYELVSTIFSYGETLEVYNVNGQRIKELIIVSEKTELDLSDFMSGIYFLKIKNQPEKSSFKIIKQ